MGFQMSRIDAFEPYSVDKQTPTRSLLFVDEIIQASFLIVDIRAIAASAALVDTLVPYDGEGLGDL
ncbi:hypothetical protein KC217_23230, partial [Mycobacterium tuberculosis]|nr:hypothetical protein [Mycobacterium tuberculosis]